MVNASSFALQCQLGFGWHSDPQTLSDMSSVWFYGTVDTPGAGWSAKYLKINGSFNAQEMVQSATFLLTAYLLDGLLSCNKEIVALLVVGSAANKTQRAVGSFAGLKSIFVLYKHLGNWNREGE